jgi:hypothetical protein
MRKILWSAAAGGLALGLALVACKAPDGAEAGRNAAASNTASKNAGARTLGTPVQAPHAGDEVRRVTPAEAQSLVERGEAVLVDVRGKEAYDAGHIKGALLFPRGEAAARASELPKDKLLIFYCA